jgi:hypothetical protein
MWPLRPTPGYKPVTTPLGKLWGRDCIYLDERNFDSTNAILSLTGEINGALCEPACAVKWIAYRIRFTGVAIYRTYDVDDVKRPNSGCSSFCEDVRAGLQQGLRRYIFATYDDVFVIDCVGFAMASGAMRDSDGIAIE